MSELIIKNKTLALPIIQGGMGIGVSLGGLAGNVAKCGGMGVISTANCGYRSPDFWAQPLKENLKELKNQIEKAKEIAGKLGMVAINIMVATTNYAETVKTAIDAGIDAIISGAGVPLELPELDAENKVALAPIVSSGKAAKVICTMWERRHGRLPDFIVVEGAQAGGHLGFEKEELVENTAPMLDKILGDVLAAILPFKEKHSCQIPVFVAGGVRTGADIAEFINKGASGVQIGTGFIATEECDVNEGFKQAIVNAKNEDVTIIKSPVGMPGRALRSPLIEKLEQGAKIPIPRCIKCLHTCDYKTTQYCISRALIAAAQGNWEEGLFFSGSHVNEITEVVPVASYLKKLEEEWRAAR